jgi:hypothetical protein
MPLPPREKGPPSLLGSSIRRAFRVGRTYLLLGLGYALVFTLSFALIRQSPFASTVPLLLPVFGMLGAMGGLMLFTNDRVKGVYEYLLAYGFSSRQVFTEVMAACLVLATAVLAPTLAVGLGVFVARGNVLSLPLVEDLSLYAVPMTYASVALAATVGMFWTSLSSPRSGMMSPVGLMPLIGLAPSLLVLLVVDVEPAYYRLDLLTGGLAVVAVVVLVLLTWIDRLLPPERLLSPA